MCEAIIVYNSEVSCSPNITGAIMEEDVVGALMLSSAIIMIMMRMWINDYDE
jgi:hypothetical protein